MRAMQLSHYIVKLATSESEPELITPLRLQKLLYYVQGWSLALRRTPVFSEHIEAWKFGPVVPLVYHRLKEFDDKPIPLEFFSDIELPSKEDQALANSIWEHYKRFSAIELKNKTHNELPWIEARKGLKDNENGSESLSPASMIKFFQAEYSKHQVEGLELEKVLKMAPPSAVKRGKPFSEVLQKAGLQSAAAC